MSYIQWIGFALAVIAAAFTGYLLGIRHNRVQTRRDSSLARMGRVVLDSFSSIHTLLNVEKVVQSFLNALLKYPGISAWRVIRVDNAVHTDIFSGETLPEAYFRDFFRAAEKSPFKDVDDYTSVDSAHPLVNTVPEGFSQSRAASIFPIYYEALGVHYFFVVYLNRTGGDDTLLKTLVYYKRQLYLLLYLKEISKKYRDNQEFLDGAFHNNPIAIAMTGKDGVVQRANREFYRLFTKNLTSIRKVIEPNLFQELLEGRTMDREVLYERKNLKVRGIPLYQMEGGIKGFLFSISDDSLQHMLYKRLESSEERYRRLLKELPLGLLILNREGLIYFVNDNFMYSVGFSTPEKLQGKSIEEFFDLPGMTFAEIIEQIEKKEYLYFKFQSKPRFGSRIFSVNLRKLFIGGDDLIEAAFQDVTLENALYAQLEDKNKLIEEDLSTARAVWEHILALPPIYSSVLRFETFYKASYQLGGDFYDVIQIDDIHIAIIIADVSGHGVSASLIASMLKILLEFAPKDPHKLADMVDYINAGLIKVLPDDQFITMFYGIIDTKSYTMDYINCGHPVPLVYDERTNEITRLTGMSFPLCSSINYSYERDLKRYKLPESCKILMYTDGLTAFKKGDRLISTADLEEMMKDGMSVQTRDILNDIYVRILKSATQFSDDDVSMLLVVLNKNLAYKKFLSIPSNVLEIDYAIIRLKESIATIVSLGEEDAWKIYTAMYEALINAVEHGNRFNVQRRVTVIYRIVDDWIVFKVRDEGAGFDVHNIPSPLDDANLLKPSGRGVYMIKKLMHKVKYNRTGNETTMFYHISGK